MAALLYKDESYAIMRYCQKLWIDRHQAATS